MQPVRCALVALWLTLSVVSQVDAFYLPGLAPVNFCKKSESSDACKVSDIVVSAIAIVWAWGVVECECVRMCAHVYTCWVSILSVATIERVAVENISSSAHPKERYHGPPLPTCRHTCSRHAHTGLSTRYSFAKLCKSRALPN